MNDSNSLSSSSFSSGMNQQLEMSRNVNDLKGLDGLRKAALSGDEKALTEAAQQFEAIFVQMMLKSMRKAQDAMADKDSPFNSQQVKFYRDMHDQQLSVDLSARGNMGIADIIVQQLSPNKEGFMPASAIRDNANLAGMVRQASASQPSGKAEPASDVSGPSKLPVFSSPSDFVQKLLPAAQEIADSLGIDAKALIAQAAVETGWGKYVIHDGQGKNSHNLFGIKADKNWQGDSTSIATVEFKDGVATRQKAAFRSYDSFTDGLKDYLSFVNDNPRYKNAVNSAADAQTYFGELQKAGYATDPQYADKIMSVLNSDTFKAAISTGINKLVDSL